MQKKIYSLLLVPCSLALCLALVFLMSCGDDKGDPPQMQYFPPSDGGFQLPPSDTNMRVHITGLGQNIDQDSWELKILGEVEYTEEYGNDPRYISSVRIQMRNTDKDTNITISMDLHNDNWSANKPKLVDLSTAQGNSFDFSNCRLNKREYQIYCYVYLSDNPDKVARIDSLAHPFKETRPHCRTYSLTVESSPTAGGSVGRSANAPYIKDQSVTLTPSPEHNYAFYNWTDKDGYYVSHSMSYDIIINDDIKLIANFVDSRNLSLQETRERNEGDIIMNTVKFTRNSLGRSSFEAIVANAYLIEEFLESREYSINNNAPRDKISFYKPGYDLPSKTDQFVSVSVSEKKRIEDYQANYYFVVKDGTNWYLLLGKISPTCLMPECLEITIWKAQ